ncbi:hypothetical protein D3C84_944940 [compost metagenome]
MTEANLGRTCGNRFIRRELHGIRIAYESRQIAWHRLLAFISNGVFRRSDIHAWKRYGRTVGKLHIRCCALWNEQCCLPCTVGIRHWIALSNLEVGRASGQLDGRYLGIERFKHDIRQRHVSLPGCLNFALNCHIALLLIVNRYGCAAIDGQIEHPVGAR